MPPLEIRLATEGDRDWAAGEMAGAVPWVTLRRSRDSLRATLSSPDYHVYVADAGGRPAGAIVFDPRGVAGAPYVKSIVVAESARGQGIGAQLMTYVEVVSRSSGARDLFLCVSSFNTRARTFYERLGYVAVGEIQEFIIPGASEVLMRKRLVGPSVRPSATDVVR
jgi:ribosomal-protein-alanine N-acetyltransferase